MSRNTSPDSVPSATKGTADSLAAPGRVGAGGTNLRTEIARLRRALKPFADACAFFEDGDGGNPDSDQIALGLRLTVGHLRAARRALEQGA